MASQTVQMADLIPEIEEDVSKGLPRLQFFDFARGIVMTLVDWMPQQAHVSMIVVNG